MGQNNNPLPEGWVWTTISDAAIVNPRNRDAAELPADLLVTFVPMAAVDGDVGAITEPRQRPLADVRKGFTSFADGDVLFAKITPCMENGKAAIARNLANGRGFGSTEFHVLRPHTGILPEWLFYFVRQEEFRREAKANFAGTAGQLRVPASFVADHPLPLPPLAEQQRIVAAIEEHLTRLDAGVAALKRAQAKLRRYKAAVLKAACEGRLVPQDPNDEPAGVLLERILAERRAKWEADELAKLRAKGKEPLGDAWKLKYEEPRAPDTSELPKLPDGWAWTRLDLLAANEANAITDGPFGSNLKTEHYTTSGPRVLRLQNIGDGFFRDEQAHISNAHFASLARHQIFAGDLVIAALGESLPRACVVPHYVGPAIVKADCIRFKSDSRLTSSSFLNIALNSEVLKKIAARIIHGVGRPRLNQQEIRSLAVPLPPFAEQERIVAEVERRLSVVEEMETAIAANLARAERLRQSILKRAFAGQLVPQDPNDEPASALLARITEPSPPPPLPQGTRGGRQRRGNRRESMTQGQLGI